MKFVEAERIRSRIREMEARREPVLLCSAGLAAAARGCEAGGAAMLVHYSCSESRLAGQGSMRGCLDDVDYAQTNMIAVPEFQDVGIPVIAGVNPLVPSSGSVESLERLKAAGFSGILCFPTPSMYRKSPERAVTLYQTAKGIGLYTVAFAFTPNEAKELYDASVDALIFHFGLDPAVRDMPLTEACEKVESIRSVWKDRPLFLHGGPTVAPEDVRYLLSHSSACGVLNGSTADEKPIYAAVRQTLAETAHAKNSILHADRGIVAKAADGAGWISVSSLNRGREVRQVCGDTPVMAEIRCYGAAPNWDALRKNGITGIVNLPRLGRLSSDFQVALVQQGISFATELEVLKTGKEKGFFALAAVDAPEQAEQAQASGLDGVILFYDGNTIRYFNTDRQGQFIYDALYDTIKAHAMDYTTKYMGIV